MTSYEMRELAMFRKQMEETEKLPLAERKANAVEWYKDLSENYMMVAERVGWLLNGSYGKGSFDSACRVLASPRMNQVAWCAITIANLEWRCPAKFAIQAWKKMPVEKRYLANQAIRQAIEDAKREGYCGDIKKNGKTYLAVKNIKNGKYVSDEHSGRVFYTSSKKDAMTFTRGEPDSEADADNFLDMLNNNYSGAFSLVRI